MYNQPAQRVASRNIFVRLSSLEKFKASGTKGIEMLNCEAAVCTSLVTKKIRKQIRLPAFPIVVILSKNVKFASCCFMTETLPDGTELSGAEHVHREPRSISPIEIITCKGAKPRPRDIYTRLWPPDQH